MREPVNNIADQSELINQRLLPPVMRELIGVLGLKVALEFVQKCGGTPYYIPLKVRPDTPIARDLGLENAQKLSAAFPCRWIHLPKADKALMQLRHRAVAEQLDKAVSTTFIARSFNYTARRIQQIKQQLGAKKPDNNLDLFPEDDHDIKH